MLSRKISPVWVVMMILSGILVSGCTDMLCVDNDEDGYGDPASESCTYPGLDCDDSNEDVSPDAEEVCDNDIDDDCDGLTDEEDPACGGAGLLPDTGQSVCYSNSGEITCPSSGASFYGQDAQHDGNQPSYQDNGDGTVTDLNTGLMWQQSPDTEGDGDIDAADMLSYDAAVAGAATFNPDDRAPAIPIADGGNNPGIRNLA